MSGGHGSFACILNISEKKNKNTRVAELLKGHEFENL